MSRQDAQGQSYIGYIVSHGVDNNPGSIFGSNIFLPSRCYTVAGWRLDQTKGDHGTVRWSLYCPFIPVLDELALEEGDLSITKRCFSRQPCIVHLLW